MTPSEQNRFIKNLGQYQGVFGFMRYTQRFLFIGLLFSPVILTWLNPKIWQQLSEADLNRAFLPIAFLVGAFALLPAFGIALVLWKRNQKRSMQLTTKQNRYLAFEKRIWVAGEKAWGKAITIMVGLVTLSAVLSFGLLLGHNAPDYYAYPFEASVLFLMLCALYQIFMQWWAERHDKELFVPAVFKVALVSCFVLVVLTWGFFLLTSSK